MIFKEKKAEHNKSPQVTSSHGGHGSETNAQCPLPRFSEFIGRHQDVIINLHQNHPPPFKLEKLLPSLD